MYSQELQPLDTLKHDCVVNRPSRILQPCVCILTRRIHGRWISDRSAMPLSGHGCWLKDGGERRQCSKRRLIGPQLASFVSHIAAQTSVILKWIRWPPSWIGFYGRHFGKDLRVPFRRGSDAGHFRMNHMGTVLKKSDGRHSQNKCHGRHIGMNRLLRSVKGFFSHKLFQTTPI